MNCLVRLFSGGLVKEIGEFESMTEQIAALSSHQQGGEKCVSRASIDPLGLLMSTPLCLSLADLLGSSSPKEVDRDDEYKVCIYHPKQVVCVLEDAESLNPAK